MTNHKVFDMLFADIYPLYINKVTRKGKTKAEVDTIICWLTGYSTSDIDKLLQNNITMKDFFAKAPQINKNAKLIRGVICNQRVEEIEDQTMQKIRYLDKLVDELAKGKQMDKILRKEKTQT